MIRVAIADDEELICLYLRRILVGSGQVEVTGHALDGEEALLLAQRTRPDVVLLDIRMPGTDGIAALPRLRELSPAPAVIMLTNFATDVAIRDAVAGGAAGVLVKSTPPEDLVVLLRIAAAGYLLFSAELPRRAMAGASVDPATEELLTGPTRREVDVLGLLAAGLSNAAIAGRLAITEPTVKSYVSSLMSKLKCTSRLQVGLLGARSGRAAPS